MHDFAKKYITKAVIFAEKSPLNIRAWVLSFVSIIAVRYLVESLLFSFEHKNLDELLGGLIHGTLLFFLFSYVVLLILLKFLTKEKTTKIASLLLWGQWLIVLPPIIDKIVFNGRTYWSFYLFDSIGGLAARFVQFFGSNPSFGITWGTRAMVAIAVLGLGLYVYYKKGKIIWFFIGAALVYAALFLLAAFPSLISFVTLPLSGHSLMEIESQDVAKQFFTSLQLFGLENSGIKVVLHYKMSLGYNLLLFCVLGLLSYLSRRDWFWALVRNIRYPQMIFNCSLFLIGIGLGWYYFPKNFSLDFFTLLALANALLAIFYAWTYSVVDNDLADVDIDRISNVGRPLPSRTIESGQYAQLGLVFALLALLSALVVSKLFFLIITGYLLTTWIYSNQPFRLKQFLVIQSVLSSFASLLLLVGGYTLVSDLQTLQAFPWRVVVFLFVTYALIIPLKDIKDMEGDRSSGVVTLPTVAGEENSRIILGALLFASYVMSVFVVGELTLFLPAVLFGSISYWIVASRKHDARILPWWVLGVVLVYGILLVMMIFR